MRVLTVGVLMVLSLGTPYIVYGLVVFPTCPPDAPPATETDLPLMQAAGISNAAVGMCWPRNDRNVGATADKAKQNLSAIVCNGSVDIAHLDAKFAVCADKFMQQLRQASPGACVRDGYRSAQTQANACRRICGQLSCPGKCAPPGYSYHQKGLAIDVSGISNLSQSWQIAASNGIVNPAGLHRSDPNHFQTLNSNCAGAPVPTNDQGDYYNDTNRFFPSPPSFPGDSLLRGLLQPPPPPPPPIQPTSPAATQPTLSTGTSAPPLGVVNTTAQSPGACAPQFYCIGNINYYRASTCVDQVYQTCANGCSGTTCIGSTTPSISNTNTNVNTNGTSTYDLIGAYANPFSSVDIATITPITLNPNTSNPDVLQPPTPQGTTPPGSVGAVQPASPQGTFVSNDLANSPTYGGPQSAFNTTLNNIRNTLLNILNYLRPFGGHAPSQVYIE